MSVKLVSSVSDVATASVHSEKTRLKKWITIIIREYGSTLYVGLACTVSPTITYFRLTFFTNLTSGGSL